MSLEGNYGVLKADGLPKPFCPSLTDFRTMMETIDYENRVDPFLEWLGELPPGTGNPGSTSCCPICSMSTGTLVRIVSRRSLVFGRVGSFLLRRFSWRIIVTVNRRAT